MVLGNHLNAWSHIFIADSIGESLHVTHMYFGNSGCNVVVYSMADWYYKDVNVYLSVS